MPPKNIVICCDGTSNEITGHSTNVLRLFRMLVHQPGLQTVYYDGGVGTLADPMSISGLRRVVRKRLDAGIGFSLRDNFCEAYSFLSRTYEPGDQIFLFGFSRGAYTVRALAGALFRLGLARPEHDNLVRYAWSIYANEDKELDDEERFGGAARFKSAFSQPVPVHLVGVWDTVSSLGWIWDYHTLPNTATNKGITHVRHAIAIDERRACFPENLFGVYGGAGGGTMSDPKASVPNANWRQVWFAGVHSDVGGGYADEEGGLSKVALNWMVLESTNLGLLIDPAKMSEALGVVGGKSKPNAKATIHESLTGWWWLLELVLRRSWRSGRESRPGGMAWRTPNLGRRRHIPEGSLFHQSVKDRMDDPAMNYRPPNLPKQYSFVV